MKKERILAIFLLAVLCLTSCSQNNTTSESVQQREPEKETEMPEEIASDTEKQEEDTTENLAIKWDEITEDGVNEDLLYENMDKNTLEYVAKELQTLVEEEAEAEKENPDIVLTEGWVRVFESEHYANVLKLGNKAMKPLYWIIYKSTNAGQYEYICAYALYEISGYDFTDENGCLTWSDSKEFLNVFNEQIILKEYNK
ncbi:hypothetical protein [Sedimentibacter sp. B4]|uniref:hypothetical protein n=1 Tax=Sedimentibacter sp. B4 TaxID=304766 RepID=UPI0004B66915|nr:hypothetical protein [Sedimentibacter sp. B4]